MFIFFTVLTGIPIEVTFFESFGAGERDAYVYSVELLTRPGYMRDIKGTARV